jgi:outer membrane protein TolC
MKPFGPTVALSLFLIPALGWGETVLTLKDAVDRALTRNLSLQRTEADLVAARRQVDQAWSALLPRLTVSTGLTRANQGQTVLGVTQDPTASLSASASVSLSLSASVLTQMENLKLNLRSRELTTESARRSVEKTVQQLWASLLLEQANIRLSQDNLTRRTKNLADVQAKYKAGLVPDVDVLSAEVSVESLRPTIDSMETTFQNDLGQLKIVLGLPLDEDLKLAGNLEDRWEDQVKLPEGPSTPSATVRQADLSVDSARTALDAQKRSVLLPTATLSWSTAPSLALKSGQTWNDTQGMLSLGLSFSVDGLLPWGQQAETTTEAVEKVAAAESQASEARLTSDLKKQNATRQILQTVKSIRSGLLNRDLAQKTYDLNQQAFQHGTKDLLSLQNAESDLSQAQYNVLAQRVSLLSAVRDLEDELGLAFGTILGGIQ